MRIDTNYAYGTHRNYPRVNNQSENVSFGLSLKFPGGMSKGRISYYSNRISSILDKDYKDVKAMLQVTSEKRASFLDNLADRYNARYFYEQKELREDPNIVIEIFKKFKHPHRQHFNIVANFDGSFAELEKVLQGVKDKKSYEFIKEMQNSVLKGEGSEKSILFEALKSPNRKKFVNKFDDYVHYFKLNSKNKNAVAELDEMIKAGNYNPVVYEREYALQNLYKHFPQYADSAVLTKEDLSKFYSKSGVMFLEDCMGILRRDALSEKAMQEVADIYKTTYSGNYSIRKSLFKDFLCRYTSYYDGYAGGDLNFQKTSKTTEEGLQILNRLYKKMDTNPNAEDFIRMALKDRSSSFSLEDYELILNTIPPKKAKIFYNNIYRVFSHLKDNEAKVEFLQKHLTDPFYQTAERAAYLKDMRKYRYIKRETFFDKAETWILNLVNKVRYAVAADKEVVKVEKAQKAAEVVKPSEMITIAAAKPVEAPVVAEELTGTKLTLARNFKSNREATRYQVISDVNNIIKKKLGMKTYDSQKAMYEQKATKMRLKLLPEIFDSIKETRAAARMAGKTTGLSKNSDAVTLYSMIMGRNRKLVNYMLKKRNIDGTRMFSVKEIIELLNKSEKAIAEQKAINHEFRAKDAKLYYDNIFDDMVSKYGKVKRVTKPKAKSQTVVK